MSKSPVLNHRSFDPVKFIGEDWTIAEQVKKYTKGNLHADRIIQKNYLRPGELSINGGILLRRIRGAQKDIQLNADDFLALWREEGHKTLNWLYETKGITWLSFWGTILRDPNGDTSVLFLDRRPNGCWRWGTGWIDYDDWHANSPAAVFASSN